MRVRGPRIRRFRDSCDSARNGAVRRSRRRSPGWRCRDDKTWSRWSLPRSTPPLKSEVEALPRGSAFTRGNPAWPCHITTQRSPRVVKKVINNNPNANPCCTIVTLTHTGHVTRQTETGHVSVSLCSFSEFARAIRGLPAGSRYVSSGSHSARCAAAAECPASDRSRPRRAKSCCF